MRLTERGFSLLQSLALTGIVATLGLAGTKMVQTQKSAQKAAEFRANIESYHSLVQILLQDKMNCKANFDVGASLNTIYGPKTEIKASPDIDTAPGNSAAAGSGGNGPGGTQVLDPSQFRPDGPVLAVGAKYFLNTITIPANGLFFRQSTVPVTPGTPNPPDTLEITYEQNNPDSATTTAKRNYLTIKKTIPIKVRRDAAGNFRDCYMDEDVYNTETFRKFCEKLDPSDETTSADNKFLVWNAVSNECTVKKRECPDNSGTIFQGFRADGTPICTPWQDVLPPNDMFDMSAGSCTPMTSNNMRLRVNPSTGKVELACTGPAGSTTPTYTGARVDGGWSAPSAWTPCKNIFGTVEGRRYQTRTCTNPTPSPDGAPCQGSHIFAEESCQQSSCFVAGTAITMHDGSTKNIEDVLLGDVLLDGAKKKVTVQKLLPLDYSGRIYSINGGPYFFTPNHPFKSLKGWKSLDPEQSNREIRDLNVTLLEIGDVLIKEDDLEIVYSLDSRETQERVYNFELDGSHEYVADGYVVHNKANCQAAIITLNCAGNMLSCYSYYCSSGNRYYCEGSSPPGTLPAVCNPLEDPPAP